MNDPNVKYGNYQPPEIPFFNYHEFLVPLCFPAGSTLVSQVSTPEKNHNVTPELSLVVHHFPNVYAPKDSEIYKTTRIVRIPRSYNDNPYSYMIPQFSLYTPGSEPAAVSGENTLGQFDGNVFGTTSKPPLVPSILSASELKDIVQTVNKFTAKAFSLDSKKTWLDNALDFFSGTLYSRLWGWLVMESYTKREIARLEEYIDTVNKTFLAQRHPLLRLISVKDSGFLSLDIQIPKPSE